MSDNYISISQLTLSVNKFFKLFSKFFPTTIYHSPYGIRTRVTAVKRRCLNPLTNGPEFFNSFYYTFFSPFVKNFFPLYRNSEKITERASKTDSFYLSCQLVARSSPHQYGINSATLIVFLVLYSIMNSASLFSAFNSKRNSLHAPQGIPDPSP